jgi:hypothetical protein
VVYRCPDVLVFYDRLEPPMDHAGAVITDSIRIAGTTVSPTHMLAFLSIGLLATLFINS